MSHSKKSKNLRNYNVFIKIIFHISKIFVLYHVNSPSSDFFEDFYKSPIISLSLGNINKKSWSFIWS